MSGADLGPSESGRAEAPEDLRAALVFDAYLEDLQAGRPADPEALVSAHPELADRLRAFLSVTNLVRSTSEDPVETLGEYRLLRELGRGGMGIVYEAEHVRRGTRAALKLLPTSAALDLGRLRRFRVEVQAAQLLDHPHIVPIESFGCDRGVSFYVMPYVEGRDLAAVIADLRGSEGSRTAPDEGPRDAPLADLPPARPEKFRQAALWGLEAAEALDHAHRQGVLHRDIKPSNLLIDSGGKLWITDFGVARVDGEDGGTQTGDLPGTLRYMSPEQALGRREVIDNRSDIYSLGVTLYELTTGRPAFEGGNRQELLRRIVQDPPPRPRRIAPAMPRDFETIVMKAMAKSREDRYPRALELAEDLRRFLEGRPILARPPGMLDLAARWAVRHKHAVVAAIASLVVAVAGLSLSTYLVLREQGRTAIARREAEQREKENLRESLLQQHQRILLTPREAGWSARAWGLVDQAVGLGIGPKEKEILQERAGATLRGLDAQSAEKFEAFGAFTLAFDAGGRRLLMGGVTEAADRSKGLPGRLWDRGTSKLEELASGGVGPVGFNAEGTPIQLVPSADGRSLELVDLLRGKTLRRIELPGTIDGTDTSALAMLADGSLVGAVARTPDGGSRLGVWSGNSGELIRHFDSEASCLAFSADGSLVAGGSEDGRVVVWSIASGEQVVTLQGGGNQVHSLAFTNAMRMDDASGGRGWRLAAGDAGGTAHLWEVDSARTVAQYRGAEFDIYAVAFSPGGTILATAGRGRVKLRQAETGDLLLDLPYSGDFLTGLAFSPDGRQLAVGSHQQFNRGFVQLWDLEDGRGVRTLNGHEGRVVRIVESSDGRFLAGLSQGWRVLLWDRSGRLLHRLEAPKGLIADNAAMAFLPEERWFAFAAGKEARIWDLEKGQAVKSVALPEGLGDTLCRDSRGRLLLVRIESKDPKAPYYGTDPAKNPRACKVRDLQGARPTEPVIVIDDLRRYLGVGATADGSTIVLEGYANPDGSARVVNAYDGMTGARRWSHASHRTTHSAVFLLEPEGKILGLLDSDDNRRPVLLDLGSGAPLGGVSDLPHALSAGAEHWCRLLGSSDDQPGRFEFYRRDDSEPLLRLMLGAGTSSPPVFSRDGRRVAWGNPDGTVDVCDLTEVRSRLSAIGLGW